MVALEDAVDREQIFDLLLRAARSKTRFAALLSVHADRIRGRRAIADDGFDGGRVDTIDVPRGSVPAFERAIASRAAAVAPLATGEPFVDGLLELLGGTPAAALILPVTIGARTVALVVAHRGDAALALDEVADLIPLVTASNPALARVLAARARGIEAAGRPASSRGRSGGAAGEERFDRADTLVTRHGSEGYEIEVSIADVAAKRAAVAAHRRAEAWDELADAIRDLIRDGLDHGEPDEDEQLELLLELGHVEAERLGRPDRAVEAWRGARTIDAGDDRALDALEQLYVQEGRWLDCVDLIDQRVALAEDGGRRIAMLLNLGALARERLDDDDRAVEAYERVLALAPAHEVAARQLEAVFAAREQWQPLAALLLDRASRHGDVAALEAVAEVYEDKLGDPRAAFLVWIAVLRREPDRPRLVDQLDRLATAADAWDELLAEAHALAAELEPGHPAAAARLWQLIGRWTRDHLANRDDAARALDRSLRLAPDDPDTASELVDILRADSRWLELVALQARRSEAEHDPGRRSELDAELGEIYETRLGQSAEALACYERALAGEPEATAVLVALHRLYLETEAWGALGELLPRLIDALGPAAPGAVVVDLHVELGGVLADHLDRPDDAVRAFRRALELAPAHAAAFHGLEQVYLATGQTQALLDTTEAEVDAAGGPGQRYADLAAAWHDCARFDRAAACWHKLLALEPQRIAGHQGLARALHDAAQWVPLVAAHRAHLALVTEPPGRGPDQPRIDLLLAIAGVLDSRLDDVEGATAACQEVTALDPHHRGALDLLGRLHDRAGRWPAALDVLQRLLEETRDPRARADVLQRIGQVHLAAHDPIKAEVSLGQAIALDPANARAHEASARVQLQAGQLVLAGEQLVRAAQLSSSRADTVRCLADAAWLYRHRLDDTDKARGCLQRILELEPAHADARQALAELLHDTREWATLWPHLEQEVRRVRDDPGGAAAERHDVYTRAARCAVELGKVSIAMELYDLACGIDPGPATQLERAEALYRGKSLEAAAAAYQAIATRHASTASGLDRAQLVQLYRRLAAIHGELARPAQAQLFHHKVLDLDPGHRDTLDDLVNLHLGRGRYDDAIASLRALAAIVPAGERIAVLERIGDLYRDKLSNPPRATSTYIEALELDPANHRILQRLLDLQSETGQWKAAVETIDRFLDHEPDPVRRGIYHVASAEIRRTELVDRAGALASYERALDELLREEPPAAATRTRALAAFRAVHDLVTADRDWKQLEQAYRRMIKRLPKDDPILSQLWHALGEIYRTGLEHPQSAIEAFEVAHSLDPEKSPQRARVLAELYAMLGAAQPAQAGGRAAKLVELDPTNPDAYRALGRTSLDAGRIDEAWCVCRALVFLDQATAEEDALYRRHQAHEVRKATGILDEDSWALVRHPDEDRTISSIFALVWEGAVALKAGPPRSFELKPKERLAVEDGTRVVAKIFRHAARVLNVPLPDVYIQPRRSGRLLLANCVEKGRLAPAVIVGRDLMTGYRDTEIAAAVGAMIALLRPAYYLKLTLASVDELEAALAAAAQLVGKQLGRRELAPLIDSFVPELQKRLTRSAAEALLGLVNRLPEQPDLARWRGAVEAAAQRAGLVVCGELAATARMVSSEATGLGGARPSQRVQDLVAYSVSPSYFAVRRHLGVAVR